MKYKYTDIKTCIYVYVYIFINIYRYLYIQINIYIYSLYIKYSIFYIFFQKRFTSPSKKVARPPKTLANVDQCKYKITNKSASWLLGFYILIIIQHCLIICPSVFHKNVPRVTCINILELVEDIYPNLAQMSHMVVVYTMETFWVPDLHPRSQECHPKSGRVPAKQNNKETFLRLEDISDSWDGDQEPKIIPMCSQQPYLSFTKGFGLIPSSISNILMCYTSCNAL